MDGYPKLTGISSFSQYSGFRGFVDQSNVRLGDIDDNLTNLMKLVESFTSHQGFCNGRSDVKTFKAKVAFACTLLTSEFMGAGRLIHLEVRQKADVRKLKDPMS